MLRSRFDASVAFATHGLKPSKPIQQCKKVEPICAELESRLRDALRLRDIFCLPHMHETWRPDRDTPLLNAPIITAIITDKRFDDINGINTRATPAILDAMQREHTQTHPNLSFNYELMYDPCYALNNILSHHISLYTGHDNYQAHVRQSAEDYIIDIYTPLTHHNMTPEDWIAYAKDNAVQQFGQTNTGDLFGSIPQQVAELTLQAARYYFPDIIFALSSDSKKRLNQEPITFRAGITPTTDLNTGLNVGLSTNPNHCL